MRIRRPARVTVGLAISALMVAAASGYAEPATQPSGDSLSPPVHLTAEQDHQRVMNLLHITSLPPGASGQHPNLDESKANPYPNLPDPLVLNNGKKVTTAAMWWTQRRPEILEYFEREIYGRTPKNTPKVTWEVTKTDNNRKTITKHLVGHVDNSSYPFITVNIELTLTTPANASGPVPVMMQFNGGPFLFRRRGPATRPGGRTTGFTGFGGFGRMNGPTWQQQVLAKGWGYATINTSTIQADNGAGLTEGIIGLVNKGQPRAGRLGRTGRLGVGRQPGAGLLPDRSGGGCEAGGHRRPFALGQMHAPGNGAGSAFRHCLCQFLRRRRREIIPSQLGRIGRERRRFR